MAMKLPGGNGKGLSSGRPASSLTACLETFPTVMEFLSSVSSGADGKRAPGTLLITSDLGKWKLKLKDPTSRIYCFVTSETVDDGLAALEAGLQEEGGLDWRPDTWDSVKGRK